MPEIVVVLELEIKKLRKIFGAKYIVHKVGDDHLLIGLYPRSFDGGHGGIRRFFRHTQSDFYRQDIELLHKWASKYEDRPYVQEVIMQAGEFPKIPFSQKPLGGGMYSFIDNVLELYGSSRKFRSVAPDILEKFRDPIRRYCEEKGVNLEDIQIR